MAVCVPGLIINIKLRIAVFALTNNHQDVFIEAIIRCFDFGKTETFFFIQRLITFPKIVNIIVTENRNGLVFQRMACQKLGLYLTLHIIFLLVIRWGFIAFKGTKSLRFTSITSTFSLPCVEYKTVASVIMKMMTNVFLISSHRSFKGNGGLHIIFFNL